MAPKNDPCKSIKAAAGSEKGPSQNPFNYMRSTISGEHDRPTKIWKFKLNRVWKVKFRPEMSVKLRFYNYPNLLMLRGPKYSTHWHLPWWDISYNSCTKFITGKLNRYRISNCKIWNFCGWILRSVNHFIKLHYLFKRVAKVLKGNNITKQI